MIHIILTCTSQKTLSTPNDLKFRNMVGLTQEDLFKKWVSAIESYPIKIPAIQLYGKTLQDFYETIDRTKIHLWIASAGMGLISPDTLIPPYDITFNYRWEDGVRRGFDPKLAEQNWWGLLCGYRGLSITDLAQQNSNDTFIFTTSESYYPALINDICAASNECIHSLFLSRWLGGGKFNGLLMPSDKRIVALIDSTEYNMASKYALFCIEQHFGGLDWIDIKRLVEQHLDTIPLIPRVKKPREKIEDIKVIEYINNNLTKSVAQITNLIRDDGYSCGSDRFNKIARQIGFKS